jgi:hypothetical protein
VQALISIPSGPAFTIVAVPWVTVAIQGFLSSVLDLTQSANVEAVGSSSQELTGAWRWVPGQTGEPPTHLLGRLCHTSRRFDGISYPSSKNPPSDLCVAVFPDRLRKPAYLKCTILTAMWRRGCRSDVRVRVVRGEWKTCKRIRLVETSSHTMKPVTPSRDWLSESPSPKYESCPVKTVRSVFP